MMLAAMAGCGGGGGGGGTAAPVIPANQAIASASAIASNDTSINTSASFTVLQNAGVAAVTINSHRWSTSLCSRMALSKRA